MEEEKKIEQISHGQDHQHKEEKICEENENRQKAKEEVEVGEKVTEIESLKKPKQSLKPSQKGKMTVPKPFSLATDERKLARERRVSIDVKSSAPTLIRSKSLINQKALPLSNGVERKSMLSRAKSVKTSSQASFQPKVTASKPVDTKDKVGCEAEGMKPRKSNTFKALSLPSFYKRNDPLSTQETKKILGKEAKSMVVDKEGKSVTNTADKAVRASSSATSSAKVTINKIMKTTRKNLTKPEEMVTVAVVSNA